MQIFFATCGHPVETDPGVEKIQTTWLRENSFNFVFTGTCEAHRVTCLNTRNREMIQKGSRAQATTE